MPSFMQPGNYPTTPQTGYRRDGSNPYSSQPSMWNEQKQFDQAWTQAKQARARALQQQQLERMAAIDEKINSTDWIQNKAAAQINPIYRPQIRGLKRGIRQTMRQGRQAASDVEGYYDSASAKVAGFGKASRRNTRQGVRNIRQADVKGGAKGISNAEGKMGVRAMRGLGKAGSSFMKQLQGAITAEGGMAAADTMNQYRQVAMDQRQDLNELRSQRQAAMAQATAEMKKKINKSGKKIYQEDFLANIGAGQTVAQARKNALQVAKSKNPLVQSAVAQGIMDARGNEEALATRYLDQITSDTSQSDLLSTASEIRQMADDLASQGKTDAAKRLYAQWSAVTGVPL